MPCFVNSLAFSPAFHQPFWRLLFAALLIFRLSAPHSKQKRMVRKMMRRPKSKATTSRCEVGAYASGKTDEALAASDTAEWVNQKLGTFQYSFEPRPACPCGYGGAQCQLGAGHGRWPFDRYFHGNRLNQESGSSWSQYRPNPPKPINSPFIAAAAPVSSATLSCNRMLIPAQFVTLFLAAEYHTIRGGGATLLGASGIINDGNGLTLV